MEKKRGSGTPYDKAVSFLRFVDDQMQLLVILGMPFNRYDWNSERKTSERRKRTIAVINIIILGDRGKKGERSWYNARTRG